MMNSFEVFEEFRQKHPDLVITVHKCAGNYVFTAINTKTQRSIVKREANAKYLDSAFDGDLDAIKYFANLKQSLIDEFYNLCPDAQRKENNNEN